MTSSALKVFKETSYPSTLQANAIYLIRDNDNSNYVEIHVADNAGNTTRRVITEADVEAKIVAKLSSVNEIKVVPDITSRDAVDTDKFTYVYVKDASDDTSVTSGGASYIYDRDTTSWVKTSESESMDVVFNWDNIQGKPNSTSAQIDDAVTKAHNHTNLPVLEKISESSEGDLKYNNQVVATTINSAW